MEDCSLYAPQEAYAKERVKGLFHIPALEFEVMGEALEAHGVFDEATVYVKLVKGNCRGF